MVMSADDYHLPKRELIKGGKGGEARKAETERAKRASNEARSAESEARRAECFHLP